MSLTIYAGRAGTGKTYACYERIAALLQETTQENIILLVPDSGAYEAERALAEHLPAQGFSRVWVVGLSRLGHHVFQSVGLKKKNTLSDVGQTLVLRSILKKREKELIALGGVAKKPGFSGVLKNIFAECKAFCVEPVDLLNSTTNIKSGILRDKVQDISVLYNDYLRTWEERGYVDSMEELIQAIPKAPLLKNAHIFVDGFQWFTPLQYRLLEQLIAVATETIVTLTLAPEEMKAAEKEWNTFHRPWEVYDTLCRTYPECKRRTFHENRRYHNSAIVGLERGYFSYPSRRYTGEERIPLQEAYNSNRETDSICRNIWRLVQEDKYRWRDITIMLRDSETYGEVLEKALQHYEIPYFSDRRHPMITHPLAEFMISLVEVLQRRFQHDAIFRLLKTDLVPLARAQVDELENYCLEFGMKEGHWLYDGMWERRRPRNNSVGEDGAEPDHEEERLSRINLSRSTFKSYILPLFTLSAKPQVTSVWVERIFTLLQDMNVPGRLSQWYEEAKARGDVDGAAQHEQMYKQLLVLLDEIAQTGGEEPITIEELGLILKEGLECLTYSLVPPTLDHVTVTTVERGYTGAAKVVFVPGLNDGIFPKRMGDEGLFSDREREELQGSGIGLAPGALQQSFHENLLLYLAMTRASDHLYLSYAANGQNGEALEAALLTKRLQELGYCEGPARIPLHIENGNEVAYLWRPRQSLAAWVMQLEGAKKGEKTEPVWWEFYDWALSTYLQSSLHDISNALSDTNESTALARELVKALLVKNDKLTGSVTRFENYYKCPFSFLARYGLKLEERPVQQFSQLERGTFLHENLRALGEYLLSQGKQWRDLSDEESEALCRQVVRDMSEELDFSLLASDEFYKNLQKRLQDTLVRTVHRLRTWSGHSDFNTVALEQSFGRGSEGWQALYIPLEDNISLRLQGQIDRIDEMIVDKGDEKKVYSLVIDYKTGSSSISAQEVYYGLKLQLLTYLLALEKNMGGIPAGLLYTFVKNPFKAMDRPTTYAQAEESAGKDKSLHNSGYFLHDTGILNHIAETGSKLADMFVPVKLTTRGDIYSNQKYKVKSLHDFDTMVEYTRNSLGKAGRKILEGEFPIYPYKAKGGTACTYCPYQAFCRFEQGCNSYRYLKNLGEEEALEKMRQEGGATDGDAMDGSTTSGN